MVYFSYSPEDRSIIEKHIIDEVPAKILGFKMYSVNRIYPVMVRTDKETDEVYGTLFTIDRPKKIVEHLHRKRGYFRHNKERSLWTFDFIGFTRMPKSKVKGESRVYAYEFVGDLNGKEPVPSGNWKEFKKQSSRYKGTHKVPQERSSLKGRR